MQTFLGLFMIIANIVAAGIVYYFLNKDWDTKRKLICLAVIFGVMYFAVSILYFLSGIGLNTSELPSSARTMLVFSFVSVNIILFMPFIIKSYNKMENKELGEKKFVNRLKLAGVLFLIVMIMEFFTIRGNIKNMFEQVRLLEEKAGKTNVMTNEVQTNVNSNVIENRSVTTNTKMNESVSREREEINTRKNEILLEGNSISTPEFSEDIIR